MIRMKKMVRPRGIEPLTFGFGNQHSIQLSYGRMIKSTTCSSLKDGSSPAIHGWSFAGEKLCFSKPRLAQLSYGRMIDLCGYCNTELRRATTRVAPTAVLLRAGRYPLYSFYFIHMTKSMNTIKPLIVLFIATIVNLMPAKWAYATLTDTDMTNQAIMTRLSPEGLVDIEGVANVRVSAVLDAARPERGGSEIYQAVCVLCHGSGAAGAPLFGNQAAWSPRKAKGMTVLLDHALHGYHYMPPRGSCVDCTDSEIKEAVRYMLIKSG